MTLHHENQDPAIAKLARDVRRLQRTTRAYGAIAVLALCAGSGAVAWAAATVGSAQIVDNSVRSVDLRNKQVRRVDLANSAVNAVKIAPDAVGSRELAKIPAVRVGRNSGLSVPTGLVGATVSFTAETVDTANMWSASSPTDVVVPRAGIYMLSANIMTDGGIGDGTTIYAQLASRSPANLLSLYEFDSATGGATAASPSAVVELEAGARVQLQVSQVSGFSKAVSSANMSVTWVGPAE